MDFFKSFKFVGHSVCQNDVALQTAQNSVNTIFTVTTRKQCK